jgi:hypothetical protein
MLTPARCPPPTATPAATAPQMAIGNCDRPEHLGLRG